MSGCRRPLAKDQWWNFCGETDMGQTAPALCTECGGTYKLKEVTNMMDERAVDAARRAADTVTGKDPGKGHFYVSVVKSIIRMFAGLALISASFVLAGILFIAAEGLGILEELV